MIGTFSGGEIVLLIMAALIILGPTRLPEYAAKLGPGVRRLRDLAEGAKGQLRDELGPGFDDIDWQQLDPRQYDPRRIVRDALREPRTSGSSRSSASGAGDEDAGPRKSVKPVSARMHPVSAPAHDPSLPTPWDVDAT